MSNNRGRLEKNSHHGYYNRNNEVEEKRPSVFERPSVFDRLGTRRENAPSGPSEDSYKSRNDLVKTHRSGHSASKRGHEGSHGKSRSRSASPRLKKKPTTSVAHRGSKSKSSIKSSSLKGDKEKQFGRKASPKRLSNKSSKMKSTKSPRPKSSVKSGIKKATSQMKGKGKIRSSSLSSDEGSTSKASSSSYTSRSRSSSSSASHATSSTTTAATTSTDSSVPSIKLKPAKKDKSKKKMKKKSKSVGGLGSAEKIKHLVSSGKRQSLSSSPSSKDSRMASHYKEMKRSKSSGMGRHKSPDGRQINSSDLKRNSQMKGIKSMDREKDQFQQQGRNFHDHMPRGKERLNFEDESRKRRLSDDNFGGGSSDGNTFGSHKRSRTVPSPSPKYNKSNNSSRRTPSPTIAPRRVPPDPSVVGHKFAPRRDRSPPPRPLSRERIRSPPRRSSFDDHRRMESPRRERGVPNYENNKMKTLMTRDRPFSSSSQHGNANYDKSNYSPREANRPGERYGVPPLGRPNPKFAPARPLPIMERGGRIAPKQLDSDRDHGPMMTKDRSQDYDSPRSGPPRGPPLLGISPTIVGNKQGLLSKPPQSQRLIIHDEPPPRQRDGPAQGVVAPLLNRHMPMIVKTKEALMERYEEQTIKQSRVDMWVDQTLKGNSCSSSISVEPFDSDNKIPSKPKLTDEAIRTSTPDENKDKCSSIGSGINIGIESTTKLDPDKIIKDVDEELSDFSDDADDILTQDIVVVVNEPPDTVTTNMDNLSITKEPLEESNNIISDGIKSNEINNMVVVSDTVKHVGVEETVSSADLDKDSARTVVSTSSLPVRTSTSDLRDGRSLPSQSQTDDDDILERMDFEEISDEDFGDVENKISIVDVLGINWASLLRRDKCETASCVTGTVRQRWTSIKVFQHVGISREHCGQTLFQKVVDKLKDTLTISPPDEDNAQHQQDENEKCEKELESPIQRLRAEERKKLFTNYGLGQHSRALSARRDMVVRRYLLNLPSKSLMSVDFGDQVSNPQEVDCSDLLKLSVSLFKSL